MAKKVLTRADEVNYEIKKSKFIAYAELLSSEQDLKDWIASLWELHPKATHICYGAIIGLEGQIEALSDNGEPHGTAGRPILDQMRGAELSNVGIAVVRYFGGTLLGTGGLVKAYAQGARELIELIPSRELAFVADYRIELSYSHHPRVMRAFANADITVDDEMFDIQVTISGKVLDTRKDELSTLVREETDGAATAIIGDSYWM